MQEERGSLQHCYHAVPESENAQQISVRGKEGRREGWREGGGKRGREEERKEMVCFTKLGIHT